MAEPIETLASIWYIEGAKEHILVDAGGSAETMMRRGLNAELICSPVEALKTVGIAPEDIALVICTHLHYDHMELGYLYKNAQFVIQKAELEANYNPHPVEAPRCIAKSVIDELNFNVVEGDTQITDGIRVLLTPGHTRGSQSVMVDTEKGKAIICGLCTIWDNFEPPKRVNSPLPVIPPGIHLDVREAFDSLIRIKQMADITIPLHDASSASNKCIPKQN